VNSAEYNVATREFDLEQLMQLSTEDLLTLALSQDMLTGLEIELLNRLEQFVDMYGDHLSETQH
jgi:hypothetical protein